MVCTVINEDDCQRMISEQSAEAYAKGQKLTVVSLKFVKVFPGKFPGHKNILRTLRTHPNSRCFMDCLKIYVGRQP